MKSNNSYLCIFLILVFTFIFNVTSTANDSTSYPFSTGIEFIKNDDISIESETLFLSERSVQVDYEFYNHSSKEVSVHMAFPLPEIDIYHRTNAWAGEPKTWDFLVYVNGKKHKNVKLRWRALIKGFDKAQLLEKLGISIDNPSHSAENIIDGGHIMTTKCLSYNLKKEDQELLLREGLIIGLGKAGNCFIPEWNAQAIYLWEARFAPNKITNVKHTYTQGAGFWTCHPRKSNEEEYSCSVFSKDFPNAVKKFGKVPIDLYFYNYVLHTGGNWKGPIKTFKFRAQGPSGSWSWVEAPFPVVRASDNALTATIQNYKPLSKAEYQEVAEKQRDSPLLRIEQGEIRFFYSTAHKERTN